MMFDYEYYLKNINNYESVINNMHNNLSRSNVDKIQSIKKTLFKFRTAIINSEFEISHTNSLLKKINNLLTTITELLNGAYLYRIFTIKNTKYKIGNANYAQTECQFRYCGTAIPFLTVRSTAR